MELFITTAVRISKPTECKFCAGGSISLGIVQWLAFVYVVMQFRVLQKWEIFLLPVQL
jgi:hypothetical protein